MASSAPLATLLDILQPSLAMYLADSGIWSYPGAEEIKLALADLVADHRSLVERGGERLDARGGVSPAVSYPIHFTGCHDVDIGALASRVIEGLRGQIGRLDALIAASSADDAAADPEAHGLAREARESSASHLFALEQVLVAARAREQGAGRDAPLRRDLIAADRMDFFDSHCHLDPMRYGGELPAVLARARSAGVVGMTVIGTRAADSEAAADLAGREPGIVAAAGIHPNDVAEAEPDEWDRVTRIVASGRAAAVGETGLDWYRDAAPREMQRESFDRHIRLAQKLGLPVIVHTRESIRDVLDMLSAALARGPLAAVLHSFTGTVAEAAEAVDLGCHLGFAGMVTFRSAASLREVAATVPAERLLVETDSPFLAPEPHRGRRNEPANVVHTARCLAIARGVALERLAAETTANARRVFLRR